MGKKKVPASNIHDQAEKLERTVKRIRKALGKKPGKRMNSRTSKR